MWLLREYSVMRSEAFEGACCRSPEACCDMRCSACLCSGRALGALDPCCRCNSSCCCCSSDACELEPASALLCCRASPACCNMHSTFRAPSHQQHAVHLPVRPSPFLQLDSTCPNGPHRRPFCLDAPHEHGPYKAAGSYGSAQPSEAAVQAACSLRQ